MRAVSEKPDLRRADYHSLAMLTMPTTEIGLRSRRGRNMVGNTISVPSALYAEGDQLAIAARPPRAPSWVELITSALALSPNRIISAVATAHSSMQKKKPTPNLALVPNAKLPMSAYVRSDGSVAMMFASTLPV